MYATKESQLAYARKWYDASSSRCRRCRRKPAKGMKFCKYHLEYARKANRAQPKKSRRANGARTAAKAKQLALDHYGRECACCGETEEKFLTFDHINGDGNKWRKKSRGSLAQSLRAAGFPKGIRVLCWNCNCSLGVYGTCPHGNLPPQETSHPANKRRRIDERGS